MCGNDISYKRYDGRKLLQPMNYLSKIYVELLAGKQSDVIETVAEVLVESDNLYFRIPKGFRSDLASIPRFLWRILSPWGPWRRAAVVHDYLYRELRPGKIRSDRIFYNLMIHDRVCKSAALIIWIGVAVGGFYAYWDAGRKMKS